MSASASRRVLLLLVVFCCALVAAQNGIRGGQDALEFVPEKFQWSRIFPGSASDDQNRTVKAVVTDGTTPYGTRLPQRDRNVAGDDGTQMQQSPSDRKSTDLLSPVPGVIVESNSHVGKPASNTLRTFHYPFGNTSNVSEVERWPQAILPQRIANVGAPLYHAELQSPAHISDGTLHYSTGLIPVPPFYRKFDVLVSDAAGPANLSQLLSLPPVFSQHFQNYLSPESLPQFFSQVPNSVEVGEETLSSDVQPQKDLPPSILIADPLGVSSNEKLSQAESKQASAESGIMSHMKNNQNASQQETQSDASTAELFPFAASSSSELSSNKDPERHLKDDLLNYIMQRESIAADTVEKRTLSISELPQKTLQSNEQLDKVRNVQFQPPILCVASPFGYSTCNDTTVDLVNFLFSRMVSRHQPGHPPANPSQHEPSIPAAVWEPTNPHSGTPRKQLRSENGTAVSAEDDDSSYYEYYDDDGNTTEPENRNPYLFGYEIRDGNGSDQFRNELSDLSGTVHGSYGYRDPVGMFRMVNYIADGEGFRAHIRSNEPGMSSPGSADVIVETAPMPVVNKTEDQEVSAAVL